MDLVQCPGVRSGCVGACVVAEDARVRRVAVFVVAAVLPLNDEILWSVTLGAVGGDQREVGDLRLVRGPRSKWVAARLAQAIAIEADVVTGRECDARGRTEHGRGSPGRRPGLATAHDRGKP